MMVISKFSIVGRIYRDRNSSMLNIWQFISQNLMLPDFRTFLLKLVLL